MMSRICSPAASFALAALVGLPCLGACGAAAAQESARSVADSPGSSARPARSWTPTADTIEALRIRIDARPIHLWSGTEHLALRHARLESEGVAFAPWEQGYDPFVYEPWGMEESTIFTGRPLRITWDRIDRIETRRSHGLLGAGIGAAAGLAVTAGLFSNAEGEESLGLIVIGPAIIVAGTVLGAIVGAMAPSRTTVWERRPPPREGTR